MVDLSAEQSDGAILSMDSYSQLSLTYICFLNSLAAGLDLKRPVFRIGISQESKALMLPCGAMG